MGPRAPARRRRPSPSATHRPRGLENSYHQDTDGNVIPTSWSMELNMDPAVDDCLVDECPETKLLLRPDGDVTAEETRR